MCFSPISAVRDINKNVFFLSKSYDKEFLLSSGYEILRLPCGKCLECRLGYARDWSFRCILESQEYEYNFFLTLTYDDNNLPVVNEKTGEILPHGTLQSSHIVKFMKDLRSRYVYMFNHVGIRFFVAGEYGDVSMRPHYHLIVFNLPIPDLEYYKRSGLGDIYFTSNLLNDIWAKGYVVIGALTAQSASYTARYCLKKTKDLYFTDRYDKLGIVPEFTNCSRRPGIGYNWFQKNKDRLFSQGFVDVSDGSKSIRVYPPRYFKKLYKVFSPDAYDDYAEMARYKAENKLNMELLQTDLNELEYLASKEVAFKSRTKILYKRSAL